MKDQDILCFFITICALGYCGAQSSTLIDLSCLDSSSNCDDSSMDSLVEETETEVEMSTSNSLQVNPTDTQSDPESSTSENLQINSMDALSDMESSTSESSHVNPTDTLSDLEPSASENSQMNITDTEPSMSENPQVNQTDTLSDMEPSMSEDSQVNPTDTLSVMEISDTSVPEDPPDTSEDAQLNSTGSQLDSSATMSEIELFTTNSGLENSTMVVEQGESTSEIQIENSDSTENVVATETTSTVDTTDSVLDINPNDTTVDMDPSDSDLNGTSEVDPSGTVSDESSSPAVDDSISDSAPGNTESVYTNASNEVQNVTQSVEGTSAADGDSDQISSSEADEAVASSAESETVESSTADNMTESLVETSETVEPSQQESSSQPDETGIVSTATSQAPVSSETVTEEPDSQVTMETPVPNFVSPGVSNTNRRITTTAVICNLDWNNDYEVKTSAEYNRLSSIIIKAIWQNGMRNVATYVGVTQMTFRRVNDACTGANGRRKRQAGRGVEFSTETVFASNDTRASSVLKGEVGTVLNTDNLLSELGDDVAIDPNSIVTDEETDDKSDEEDGSLTLIIALSAVIGTLVFAFVIVVLWYCISRERMLRRKLESMDTDTDWPPSHAGFPKPNWAHWRHGDQFAQHAQSPFNPRNLTMPTGSAASPQTTPLVDWTVLRRYWKSKKKEAAPGRLHRNQTHYVREPSGFYWVQHEELMTR